MADIEWTGKEFILIIIGWVAGWIIPTPPYIYHWWLKAGDRKGTLRYIASVKGEHTRMQTLSAQSSSMLDSSTDGGSGGVLCVKALLAEQNKLLSSHVLSVMQQYRFHERWGYSDWWMDLTWRIHHYAHFREIVRRLKVLQFLITVAVQCYEPMHFLLAEERALLSAREISDILASESLSRDAAYPCRDSRALACAILNAVDVILAPDVPEELGPPKSGNYTSPTDSGGIYLDDYRFSQYVCVPGLSECIEGLGDLGAGGGWPKRFGDLFFLQHLLTGGERFSCSLCGIVVNQNPSSIAARMLASSYWSFHGDIAGRFAEICACAHHRITEAEQADLNNYLLNNLANAQQHLQNAQLHGGHTHEPHAYDDSALDHNQVPDRGATQNHYGGNAWESAGQTQPAQPTNTLNARSELTSEFEFANPRVLPPCAGTCICDSLHAVSLEMNTPFNGSTSLGVYPGGVQTPFSGSEPAMIFNNALLFFDSPQGDVGPSMQNQVSSSSVLHAAVSKDHSQEPPLSQEQPLSQDQALSVSGWGTGRLHSDSVPESVLVTVSSIHDRIV